VGAIVGTGIAEEVGVGEVVTTGETEARGTGDGSTHCVCVPDVLVGANCEGVPGFTGLEKTGMPSERPFAVEVPLSGHGGSVHVPEIVDSPVCTVQTVPGGRGGI
jgi:hypothetical protein